MFAEDKSSVGFRLLESILLSYLSNLVAPSSISDTRRCLNAIDLLVLTSVIFFPLEPLPARRLSLNPYLRFNLFPRRLPANLTAGNPS